MGAYEDAMSGEWLANASAQDYREAEVTLWQEVETQLDFVFKYVTALRNLAGGSEPVTVVREHDVTDLFSYVTHAQKQAERFVQACRTADLPEEVYVVTKVPVTLTVDPRTGKVTDAEVDGDVEWTNILDPDEADLNQNALLREMAYKLVTDERRDWTDRIGEG
jgi:hypothetical protein